MTAATNQLTTVLPRLLTAKVGSSEREETNQDIRLEPVVRADSGAEAESGREFAWLTWWCAEGAEVDVGVEIDDLVDLSRYQVTQKTEKGKSAR